MKEKLRKLVLVAGITGGAMFMAITGLRVAVKAATYFDPSAEAGFYRLLGSGVAQWVGLTRQPDNALEIYNTTTGQYAVRVDTTNFVFIGPSGLTGITPAILGTPNMTSTQVQAAIPQRKGGLIYNTTLSQLCTSTGVAVSAFSQSTNTAANCY